MNNEQAIASVKFYKALGWESNQKVLQAGKIVDIFSLLKFKPVISNEGNREATPYEILGVPPQLDENNNEKPIVFAIKNRTTKIGKYTGLDREFVYSSKRVKEEDSLLEKLKKGYKRALLSGNQAEAEKYLELLDNLTGGRVEEFLEDFYDYTKFYRRMKKQLLIDIFSHFFLLYVLEKKNNKTVKEGIVNKNRIFRAYKEESQEQNSYSDELNEILAQNKIADFPVITKVQVESGNDLEIQQEYSKPNNTVHEKIEVSKNSDVFVQPEPVVQPHNVRDEIEKEEQEELEEREDEMNTFQYPQNLDEFFTNMNSYITADESLNQEEIAFVDEAAYVDEGMMINEGMNESLEIVDDSENFENSEKENNESIISDNEESQDKNKEKEEDLEYDL